MKKLMRCVAAGLALPLAVGVPVVVLAGPAYADTTEATVITSDAVSAYGQEVTATATVMSGSNLVPRGTVTFLVDGAEPGVSVPLVDGHATSPVLTGPGGLPLEVTEHSVTAQFTPHPDDGSAYFPDDGSTPQTVEKAGSTLAVLPGPSGIVADLSGQLPGGVQSGSLKPSGTVTFTVDGVAVGTAPVAANGRATLGYVVPPGAAHLVTASYPGDSRYTGSADVTPRIDPGLAALVLGKLPKSKSGWYHTPVTVLFICRSRGAELAEDCPLEVVLKKSGKGQSVSRTIHAIDGGAATVLVDRINIDRDDPEVSIVNGKCKATDELSGIKSCTLRTTSDGKHVVAIATDKAGNRAIAHG
jgi:hypothetical protein